MAARNPGNLIRKISSKDFHFRLFGELKDYGLLLQFLLELWMKIEEIDNFEDAIEVSISFF